MIYGGACLSDIRGYTQSDMCTEIWVVVAFYVFLSKMIKPKKKKKKKDD